MKILTKLHIVFYISLLIYICLIPNNSTDSNIVKVLFTLIILALFIGMTAMLSVVTFNKEFSTEKRYAYAIVFLLLLNVVIYLPLGHSVYEVTSSLLLLICIMAALFILTNILVYKLKDSLLRKGFDYSGELKQFLKMGDSLKGTPLMKMVNRLDYFFYGYCIAVFTRRIISILVSGHLDIDIFCKSYETIENGISQKRIDFQEGNVICDFLLLWMLCHFDGLVFVFP